MSKAHLSAHIPGYNRLTLATGPTLALDRSPSAANQPAPTMTASTALAEQFLDKVADHQKTTGADFAAAWESCKRLFPALWNEWQATSKAVNVRAANDAPSASEATTKSAALAEFNRRVNERMQSAGENYGAAWAFVSQTQPRLHARMNGDAATDKQLADAGHSAPTIRN